VINRHIRRPWPHEIQRILDDLRQGDVVSKPPFFYAHGGPIRLWEMPGSEEPAADEEEDLASQVEELHPDDGPPLGIITTQTCDIGEQGAPSQPWLQVSPVYLLPNDPADAERMLAKHSTVELDGPILPVGRWIADLRIEFPIEKSWLVDQVPVRGFRSESCAEAFGVQLGRRRARPALANALVDNVTSLIRRRKKAKPGRGKTRDVWQRVHRVMIEIEGGTRLTPAAVRLHVLTVAEPPENVLEWFAAWEDEARLAAEGAGIELHMTHFHDACHINLHEYDRWVELDFR
jgi:hypothetical protein